MFHSITILLINLFIITRVSSQNLSGIFRIDTCECNSPTEECGSNGPFIVDQQRSTIAIRRATVQVGVGVLEDNHLDLYLNHNRCKGSWNRKEQYADLTCQHKDGIICTSKFRCISGSCRVGKSLDVSSSATTIAISVLMIITSLFMFIY